MHNLVGQAFMYSKHRLTVAPATKHVGVPQCNPCWRYGHLLNAWICLLKGKLCPICREPHSIEYHCHLASCCHGKPKQIPPHPSHPWKWPMSSQRQMHQLQGETPHGWSRLQLLEIQIQVWLNLASLYGTEGEWIFHQFLSFQLTGHSSSKRPSPHSKQTNMSDTTYEKFAGLRIYSRMYIKSTNE